MGTRIVRMAFNLETRTRGRINRAAQAPPAQTDRLFNLLSLEEVTLKLLLELKGNNFMNHLDAVQ
jgi:hypothetical protein